LTGREVEEILRGFANVSTRENWPTEDSRAFYMGENLFAIIHETSDPLKIDLKIDANLAKLLRGKYESVAFVTHLDKRFWVEILATGQLSDDEIRDLLRHAYEFAKHSF